MRVDTMHNDIARQIAGLICCMNVRCSYAWMCTVYSHFLSFLSSPGWNSEATLENLYRRSRHCWRLSFAFVDVKARCSTHSDRQAKLVAFLLAR